MDGSLFLVILRNTSVARRCRKGAIHPIIRSPLLLGGLAFVTGRCETLKGDDLRKTPPARLVLDLVRAIAIRARASLRNRHQRPLYGAFLVKKFKQGGAS